MMILTLYSMISHKRVTHVSKSLFVLVLKKLFSISWIRECCGMGELCRELEIRCISQFQMRSQRGLDGLERRLNRVILGKLLSRLHWFISVLTTNCRSGKKSPMVIGKRMILSYEPVY